MIDVFYNVGNQCVGVVETVGYAYITITKEEWAPGIWAGVTDAVVAIKETDLGFYKCSIHVTYCDLENRRIYHKVGPDGPNLAPGDKLFLTVKVEDGR